MHDRNEDINKTTPEDEPITLHTSLEDSSVNRNRRLLFFIILGCFLVFFVAPAFLRYVVTSLISNTTVLKDVNKDVNKKAPPLSDWLQAYPNSESKNNCSMNLADWTVCRNTSVDSAQRIASFYENLLNKNGFVVKKHQSDWPNGFNIHIFAKDEKTGKLAFLDITETKSVAKTNISMRFR
jgi:hypothetical protein